MHINSILDITIGTFVEQVRFNKIYDLYSKKLYNYALWLTRNKDSSNDIVQTVFIKFWKNEKIFDQDCEIEAWLYKVTRNACIDFFRKCSRNTKFRLKYLKEIPLFSNEPQENKSVWNMLDRLSEKERSILYLYYRMGYPHKNVAQILNITESCVRTSSFRALEKLRKKCNRDLV